MTGRLSALPVGQMPQPDKLPGGVKGAVTRTRQMLGRELLSAFKAPQVARVIPDQVTQAGEGKPPPVAPGTKLRTPQMQS